MSDAEQQRREAQASGYRDHREVPIPPQSGFRATASDLPRLMGSLGEIFRWNRNSTQPLSAPLRRGHLRLAGHLLRRDQVVAGSERKFRALLESAPDAIVIVDGRGQVRLVNGLTEKRFGWVREEIVGRNISTLFPDRFRAPQRDHLKNYLRSAGTGPMSSTFEMFGLRKDGSEFPVEISLGPLQTGAGLLVSAVIRDISARRRAEIALREAEERFRTAFEEAPVGMALAALDGRLVQVNRAMCEITGHSREQLEATTFASFTHPDDAQDDVSEMRRLVAGESSRYRAERRYLHSDGHPVPVDLSVAVIRDGEGTPEHLLAQVHDITERKRFEGQLQYLVDHDALTGMFNRRRFEQELRRELARAGPYNTGGALLAIDLDHFKYVNDTLGHTVGDDLITRTGRLFRGRLRGTDIIARLGGDEFAVILPGADEPEAALVADNLLNVLRTAGRLQSGPDRPKRVTASIGIALFGNGSSSSEELLVEADIAMYEAKESGRDRYEIYDTDENQEGRMQARLKWVDRIRDALEDDSFVLHAQPILSLNGDDVPRHELLIRMIGEGNDLIPPGTFLYIGERFDLIQEIDRWVLAQAIALLARAKRAGQPIHLEVNLSAKSVTDPRLSHYVAEQLDAAGIDGSGLCVEVTETAAIVNVDVAKQFAHTLGELGCEFALDDFGAGFASFYYLKHMAFDYVKIDGEFIRHLPTSRINQLVVQSVVDIARGLGKRTIAEFVGDEETLSLLRRYGVDYAQGFHVAKPQSLDELDLMTAVPAPPAVAG